MNLIPQEVINRYTKVREKEELIVIKNQIKNQMVKREIHKVLK